MDLLQGLRMAATVWKAGSFSAAARQAGLSPAAVAKQVAQLEARLALRLFERTTHHLAITDEGRSLLERLAAPLRELEEALAAGTLRRGASGRVKVSVPATFARMAVIPALPAFLDRHPGIEIDLRLENRRVDLVAEGYDCAIGTELALDATYVARPIATLRSVLCAAPGYLAARGEPQNLADLAAHRCIALRSDTTGRVRDWELVVRGRSQRVSPPAPLVMTDPESVAAAAVAGCGIALIGLHHVARALIEGQLVRVLKDAHGTRFRIVVYYARRQLLPPRTRAFVEHVIETASTTPTLHACRLAMDAGPANAAV